MVLVTALHDADTLGGTGASVVELGVPCFDAIEDDVEKRITSACKASRIPAWRRLY